MIENPQKLFDRIAEILKLCNPPHLRIGELNGNHANFADLNGDKKIKVQVQWRPPNLEPCLVFDDINVALSQTKAEPVERALASEIRGKLIVPASTAQHRVYKMQIPIAAFENVDDLASVASAYVLLLIRLGSSGS